VDAGSGGGVHWNATGSGTDGWVVCDSAAQHALLTARL